MWFLFKKKVKIIDTNSREDCHRREEILKKAGIRSNSWSTEAFPVIGGPHMKTADWSGNKYENKDDQRIVYHIEVAKEDEYRAMKVLMESDGVDLSR